MEEKVIHLIDGEQYVLFTTEVPVNYTGSKRAEKLEDKVKYFKGFCISQEVKKSFWNGDKATFKYLIPSIYAKQFGSTGDDDYAKR